MNRNINDDSQRFHLLKTHEPSLYDEMTKATTTWDASPIRRINCISGPNSAFARLFPEKYRQEQELIKKQRSKSNDNQRFPFDRIQTQHTISDDDDGDDDSKEVGKSRRVKFQTNVNDSLKTRTKSEPFLNQIDLSDSHYPVNYDPNPEIIYRDNPDNLVYTQNVGVRYLRPPPPPPGPILIREMQSTPPAEPPPLIVSTKPPVTPRTPSPLIVREEPPTPPEYQPAKVITKTLRAPPTPPRRVITKRIPPLPAKPRPVIIEKWLPYKTSAERPIHYQRAEQSEQSRPIQRNLILQYQPPRLHIKQELQNFGCFRVDPNIYRAEHGSSLRRTGSIRKVLENIGCNTDLITSTGYSTCYPESFNQTNYSSHYDYPRRTTTDFTDEQVDALIGSSLPTTTDHHYDIPRIHDEDEDYYR